MLPIRLLPFVFIAFFLFPVQNVFAGDGAYIIFKDGKEANIRDGYKQLMAAMRKRKDGKEKSRSVVVELNMDGHALFIDVSEVTVLCRVPCRSFQVVRQRQ